MKRSVFLLIGILILIFAAISSVSCSSEEKEHEERLKSTYELAERLRENGDYTEALNLYEGLGDYLGSRYGAALCRAQIALGKAEKLFESGSYSEALQTLEALDESDNTYETTLMLEKCRAYLYYEEALVLMERGEYRSALNLLSKAAYCLDDDCAVGDKIENCNQQLLIEEGERLYSLGAYDDAIAVFGSLSDSALAKAKKELCEMAKKLDDAVFCADSGEHKKAYAVLKELSESASAEASEKLEKAVYYCALRAFEGEDTESALNIISLIIDEIEPKDENELVKLKYELARQCIRNGEYESAITLLEGLDYEDSAALYKNAVMAATPVTLIEALEQGIIEITFLSGSNITQLKLEVKNLTGTARRIWLNYGLWFDCIDPYKQNMLLVSSSTFRVKAGETKTVYPSVAGMNIERSVPNGDDTFTLDELGDSSIHSRLLRALDAFDRAENAGNPYSFAVKQAAVWIITGGADYESLGIITSADTGQRLIGESEYQTALAIPGVVPEN